MRLTMIAGDMTSDARDPRTLLEESETQDALRLGVTWCLEAGSVGAIGARAVQVLTRAERAREECDRALRSVLAWCCEAERLARIGERVIIAAAKLQFAEAEKFTQGEIAALTGCGRSHANKLAVDCSNIFEVRGPHDRTPQARIAYQAAWRKSHLATIPPANAAAPARAAKGVIDRLNRSGQRKRERRAGFEGVLNAVLAAAA